MLRVNKYKLNEMEVRKYIYKNNAKNQLIISA